MLKSIVVIDDDSSDLDLIRRGLEEAGLADKAVFFPYGTDAADYLLRRGRHAERQAGNPALVILDIAMPLPDGFDLLKLIREEAALRFIPVVTFTRCAEDEIAAVAYKLQSNAFVAKPKNQKAFIDMVAKIGIFWLVVNKPPPHVHHFDVDGFVSTRPDNGS